MTFVIYVAWRTRPIVVRIFNNPTAKSVAIKSKIAEAAQKKARREAWCAQYNAYHCGDVGFTPVR